MSLKDKNLQFPGVYVVTNPIPSIGAHPGDHVVVRETHVALHRYLADFDTETTLRSGLIERVADVTPVPVSSLHWRRPRRDRQVQRRRPA